MILRNKPQPQSATLNFSAAIILLALFLVLGHTTSALATADKQLVRIGVTQDPPLIWRNEQGQVRGFFADILEHIAHQENWQIEYIPVPWCGTMEMLKSGDVDLIPGVYPRLNTEQDFTLSESPILIDWGQVYSSRDANIQTILDLEGKRIAVESSCVFFEGETGIGQLVEKFNVNAVFVGFTNPIKALQDFRDNKVDAIVLGRFYNNMEEMGNDIVKTPILLNPITLYFGAPKNSYSPHLNVIDAHIREMKSNRASIYYQSWDKWFSRSLGTELPTWLLHLAAVLGGAALLLFGFSLFARYQVEKKTREISVKNERLRSLSMELTLVEEEERRRLAELLHDNLGQNLALTKIRLSAMETSAAAKGCQDALADIKSFLNQAIHATRSLTTEMSPPALYNLTFGASLKWLAENILRSNNIEVEVINNGQEITLAEDTKVLLFKTIRELLVNIVKHAAASYVKIELKVIDQKLLLSIEDNGVGMQGTPLSDHDLEQTGFGLLSIRERLTYLGGEFQISSIKGTGTSAHLQIPLEKSINRGTK